MTQQNKLIQFANVAMVICRIPLSENPADSIERWQEFLKARWGSCCRRLPRALLPPAWWREKPCRGSDMDACIVRGCRRSAPGVGGPTVAKRRPEAAPGESLRAGGWFVWRHTRRCFPPNDDRERPPDDGLDAGS